MSEWSKELAAHWGEEYGRSVSEVLGHGLSAITGGDLEARESKNLVHAGMIAAGVGTLVSPNNTGTIATLFAFAVAFLWSRGQDKSEVR